MPSSIFIKYYQFFLIPLFKLVLAVAIKDKSIHLKAGDLKDGKKYIFVSNHRSLMDAFYICYSMSFDIHKRLGPYRFFLANRFLDNLFLSKPLLAFGSFPAKRHERYPYGLRMAENLLGNNETVVIFPEGKIARVDKQHEPRHGVEVLAKMPDVQLIPVRVDWQRDKGFVNSYRLSIGRPFDGSDMTARQIMDKVYGLKL